MTNGAKCYQVSCGKPAKFSARTTNVYSGERDGKTAHDYCSNACVAKSESAGLKTAASIARWGC